MSKRWGYKLEMELVSNGFIRLLNGATGTDKPLGQSVKPLMM